MIMSNSKSCLYSPNITIPLSLFSQPQEFQQKTMKNVSLINLLALILEEIFYKTLNSSSLSSLIIIHFYPKTTKFELFNVLLFNIDIHSLSQNHKPISTFPGSRESATFHMGPIIWEEGVPNTSPSMVVHHSIMFPARLFLDQRMVITGC